MANTPQQEPCKIGHYCRRHEFIHGGEAEELRERLEALNIPAVQRILDDVSARDALAWLEAKKELEHAEGDE